MRSLRVLSLGGHSLFSSKETSQLTVEDLSLNDERKGKRHGLPERNTGYVHIMYFLEEGSTQCSGTEVR